MCPLPLLLLCRRPERQRVVQVPTTARGNDSCGVRTHALSDWRLKPAPYTARPNCLDCARRALGPPRARRQGAFGPRCLRGGRPASKTLCLSGLRGWTQVPLAQAAWVQIPQVSLRWRIPVAAQSFLLVAGCARPGNVVRRAAPATKKERGRRPQPQELLPRGGTSAESLARPGKKQTPTVGLEPTTTRLRALRSAD